MSVLFEEIWRDFEGQFGGHLGKIWMNIGGMLEEQKMKNILHSVTLLTFWKITQTYKRTPSTPPHPTPPPPLKEREGQAPPPLWGGGVGWGGGGVRLYVCVFFRKNNKEVQSILFHVQVLSFPKILITTGGYQREVAIKESEGILSNTKES